MVVTTSSKNTCPSACPLKKNGCYAENGSLRRIWDQTSRGEYSTDLDGFAAKIKVLRKNQIWRMNQAGDLPGHDNEINRERLAKIIEANRGKNGFTYTHKPVIGRSKFVKSNRAAVKAANENGFIINLSANNLKHADKLTALKIAPVVVVLPPDAPKTTYTPKGNKVITCPATYKESVTCESCRLCAKGRSVIVGFPVHGTGKNKAAAVCESY